MLALTGALFPSGHAIVATRHAGVTTGGRVTAYSLNRKTRGPLRHLNRRVIVMRVFAWLCAIGLVGAFAIAATLPLDMSLGAMLLSMDPKSLQGLHEFIRHHGIPGTWQHVLMPFLLRPGWMLPLMAGVIAGGIAFSVNHVGPTRQSSRRSR